MFEAKEHLAGLYFSYAVNSKQKCSSDDAAMLNSIFLLDFTTGVVFESVPHENQSRTVSHRQMPK